jgi:hypothetical protein
MIGPWFKAHLQGKNIYTDNTRRFALSSNIINVEQTVPIFHPLAANILTFTYPIMVFRHKLLMAVEENRCLLLES